VIVPEGIVSSGTRILISSRAVLAFQEFDLPTKSVRICIDGDPVGWVVASGDPIPSELGLRNPDAEPSESADLELRGSILNHPWDLLAANQNRITDDIRELFDQDHPTPGAYRVGAHQVSLGEEAIIEAGVHLDLRSGPIRIDSGVRVEGPARLKGPLYVGQDSIILGGSVGTSSIGPMCRVRGEVADSVFLGYGNKAHEGYIGHALVGRWVNLGALTTNSDLKNNYTSVRIWTPQGDEDSGLIKVGCFIGDHVTTGIGTLLNTGAVIGAGSNIFGGLMAPSVVPPFSWGSGEYFEDHRLEKFLQTAERVMARRGQKLTSGMEKVLRIAWDKTEKRRRK
tara:strand:- start:305 stop:1321 length:1017 start_codon:yes stop_codon:yes gene_type:complete